MDVIFERMTQNSFNQGIIQGEQNKTSELARKLTEKGVSASILASAIGTNEEEVKSWV